MKEKTIYRVRKTNNYTVINNVGLYDKRLSWKSKGLLAHMLSRPDDWEFHNSELVKHARDGIDSVKSGIKELRDAGYIKRRPVRDEKGRIEYWETVVYETPEMAAEENPDSGNDDGSGNNDGKYLKSGNDGKYPEVENPLVDQTRAVDAFYPEVDYPLVENPLVENPLVENPPLLNTDYLLNTDRDNTTNNINKGISPFQYFTNEGFGVLTDTTSGLIIDWLDHGGFEEPEGVVIEAMKQAVINNKRSWSYVEQVLQDWRANGVKTVADVEKREKEWDYNKRMRRKGWRMKVRSVQEEKGDEKKDRQSEGERMPTAEDDADREKRFNELMEKIKQARIG